jgi:hypothetical protein
MARLQQRLRAEHTCQDLRLPSAGKDDQGNHGRVNAAGTCKSHSFELAISTILAHSGHLICILSLSSRTDTLHSFARSALRRNRHSADPALFARVGFTARLATSAQGTPQTPDLLLRSLTTTLAISPSGSAYLALRSGYEHSHHSRLYHPASSDPPSDTFVIPQHQANLNTPK